jgi:hypothetical protein
MKLMGHSTVTVSQRYVHPTPETLEWAFDRVQKLNQETAVMVSEFPKGKMSRAGKIK